MRSILALGTIVFFLLFHGNILLLQGRSLGKTDPGRRDAVYLAAIQRVLRRTIIFSGLDITVIGRDNIPDDRPVLYVSNHRSYYDIIIGYTLVKGLCGFVAKQEFEKIPLFSTWMRVNHCLFLNRDDPREGMRTIQDAIANVKNGISVWICPEGTRNHGDEMLPFKSGSFRIAEKTGCPIIPVAFTHTDDVLEKHFPWVRPCHVTVEFGTPVETADLTRAEKKELPARTQGIIEEMYRKNL